MEKIRCIHCGSDMVLKGYDYDNGIIRYECQECGEDFTENDIKRCEVCDKQVLDNEYLEYDDTKFCSDDCLKKYKETNH